MANFPYYTANNLNQYTQRTVPNTIDIIGSATNTATVTVNDIASYRKSDYYRAQLTNDNSASPLYVSVTNLAVVSNGTNADTVTNITGNIFVPKAPETYAYDADGNMTNDGRWAFVWDAENRLISQKSLAGAPSSSSNRLVFAYDWQSRRMSKVVSNFTGGSWTNIRALNFQYDGWSIVGELSSSNSLARSCLWGTDLSGSPQGAGGVGGLLAMTDVSQGTHFPAYDGNGNVAGLVKATAGTASANYEYSAFGETIRSSGTMAKTNCLRFSTKFTDEESDFLYYGYRYGSPKTGRWVSRDPIGERGFSRPETSVHRNVRIFRVSELANEYSFVKNSGPNLFDAIGLSPSDVSEIEGAAIGAFFELCDDCRRCDNGARNNIQRTFGAPYLGCGEQALYAQNRIQSTLHRAQDTWTPDIPQVWQPLPHQFLTLTSKNALDPKLTVDLHGGVIKAEYPAQFFGNFFEIQVDLIRLKCQPRSATFTSSKFHYDAF